MHSVGYFYYTYEYMYYTAASLSLRGKGPVYETDLLPSHNAEVRFAGSFTSTPTHIFMIGCWRHRKDFSCVYRVK
jgi:hypothetical protein